MYSPIYRATRCTAFNWTSGKSQLTPHTWHLQAHTQASSMQGCTTHSFQLAAVPRLHTCWQVERTQWKAQHSDLMLSTQECVIRTRFLIPKVMCSTMPVLYGWTNNCWNKGVRSHCVIKSNICQRPQGTPCYFSEEPKSVSHFQHPPPF